MFMGVLYAILGVSVCKYEHTLWIIYTYRRGPLRCLSLSEGNAKAMNVG